MNGERATHALSAVSNASGRYVHWGVIQISLTNLLVIVFMVVLFIAALLAPFPGGRESGEDRSRKDSDDGQN